jgi:hypothetical protein
VRNLAVASLLVRTLQAMNPMFPEADPALDAVVIE